MHDNILIFTTKCTALHRLIPEVTFLYSYICHSLQSKDKKVKLFSAIWRKIKILSSLPYPEHSNIKQKDYKLLDVGYRATKFKNNHPPISNAQYVRNDRISSTTFYKCFKTGSCDSKGPMLIRMKLLQIAYNAAMF